MFGHVLKFYGPMKDTRRECEKGGHGTLSAALDYVLPLHPFPMNFSHFLIVFCFLKNLSSRVCLYNCKCLT